MRELTKSMMSFSWAMSLFGLRQMTNMLLPQTMGNASSAFNSVTRSTRDQLGDFTQGLFQSGDQLQRSMVDWTFNVFGLGLIPGLGGCGSCGPSTGPTGQHAPPAGGSAPAPGSSRQQPPQQGWGPMPGGV